jgi:hypothetical protein
VSKKYFLMSEAGRHVMESVHIDQLYQRMRSMTNAVITDETGTEVHPVDKRTKEQKEAT